MRSLIQRGGIVLAASFALACGGAADAADAASSASSAGAADAEGAADAARGGVSDSTSMQAGLARYQAALAAHPTAFDGSLATPEDVARELLGSLAASDTAALLALAVSRAEYAYLVYPESRLVRAPYRQPVDVAWALHAAPHAKGLTRLLQRLGGRSLAFRAVRCRPGRVEEGRNRYWTGCQVRFSVDGDLVEARLFTAIVARDGRLNIASYDNDF